MKQISMETSQFRKNSLADILTKNGIYGGSIGYRKLERPLSTQKAIHLTFKMNEIAFKKSGGFRKNVGPVEKWLMEFSKRFEIRIYKHSVNSNHMHIFCRMKDRKQMAHFLRCFSGAVGRHFKRKFNLSRSIWQGRPFTKLIHWGRHAQRVFKYVEKNAKEVLGFANYTPRPRIPVYTLITRWASTG